MVGAPVETITGRLGVGAICFLAFFLMVDGMQIGVFNLVEIYGKSVTFGIVIAFPTAVVTYILGVFCVGIADLILSRFNAFSEPDPTSIIALSQSGGDLLQQSYSENLRNFELLKGSSVAFFLLAIGVALDVSNMQGNETIVKIAFLIAIGLSALSFVFARRTIARAKRISKVIVSKEPLPFHAAYRRKVTSFAKKRKIYAKF